jgi:hypothetical protein
MRKVDDLQLNFIDFYIPALTQCLNSSETSLQFSENITLVCVCVCVGERERWRERERKKIWGDIPCQPSVCQFHARIISRTCVIITNLDVQEEVY